MLKFVEAEGPNEKNKILDAFDPEVCTWIVADLNSKTIVQTKLLQKCPCLPEDAVLRVSEFWKKILNRSAVDIEIVSVQFAATLLAEWLKKRDLNWARHPGVPRLLMQYIGEFLPALARPDLVDRLREWLRENPTALLRWGNWLELSVEAWDYFREEKILPSSWISAFLAGQEWPNHIWSRSLFVDIGPDMNGVEIELFQQLAKDIDVSIIIPAKMWREKFRTTLWPYDVLAGEVSNLKPGSSSEIWRENGISCHRFTTQIAEVKAATAQVRQWVEEGISIEKIGLLAADIESYWPALEGYLGQEGLPICKDVVVSAAAMPGVAKWLSRLKIESQEIESSDLELSVFQSQKKPPMEFAEFQQLFSRIYDRDDLNRDQRVRDLFMFEYKGSEVLSREQFFGWALKFWPSDVTGIELIAAEILSECPVSARLELYSWISYISSIVAKVEMKVKLGRHDGLVCCNFNAAHNLQFERVVLLGLSEGDLHPSSEISVSANDVNKLAQDLGLYLNSPDQKYNEYLAEKILWQTSQGAELYFAASNFSGQAQAPSLFWLRQALIQSDEIEKCEVPPKTRWDEIQNVPFGEQGRSVLEKHISQDLGFKEADPYKPHAPVRFSASQIEKYLNCPFIFTAEKLFHLSDLPDVDLDMDAMTRGQISHALLERLLAPPLKWERSDGELEQIIDDVRARLAVPLGDERLWPAKRRQFMRIARNFLEFEREWRAQFPKTQTVAREMRIGREWQLTPDIKIEVSGQIDRVDQYQNGPGETPQYVIVDYKSSAANLHSHGSWLKNEELQLAFYTLAITEGLTELPVGDVIGAFYYVLATMDREKGFRLKEQPPILYSENGRNKSALTKEGLQALLNEVRAKISDVVTKIYGGNFAPVPKEKKDCVSCNWSTLCRAPHLN